MQLTVVLVQELALVIIQFCHLNHIARSISLSVLRARKKVLNFKLSQISTRLAVSSPFQAFDRSSQSRKSTLIVDVPRPIYYHSIKRPFAFVKEVLGEELSSEEKEHTHAYEITVIVPLKYRV